MSALVRRQPSRVLGAFFPVKSPKAKVCKVCKGSFSPHLSTQLVCGLQCAQSLAMSINGKARKVAAVKERKADKARLDSLKSLSKVAAETQVIFNAWVRQRDAGLPCISCGRHHQGQYHAGHFLSVGARPEIRFSETNVNKQCQPCNLFLSGNAILYRAGLIERIGLAAVESLEGPHPTQHYTRDELTAIRADYAARTRALKAAA